MRSVVRIPGVTAAMLAAAVTARIGNARADVVETRMLEESVPVDGDAARLRVVVDNVIGSIRVTAHDEPVVAMQAVETIRADTQSDLERARAEVELRTEVGEDSVAFRVRDADEDCDCRWRHWDDYVVEYDIELRVPRAAAVDLSTVNGGEIVATGVAGEFEVANVNGAVRLEGLRGAGSASTVNGRIEAVFDAAPPEGTSFKTVNGRIDVTFPAGLSADLELRTMHGEMWTDFDVEPLPVVPVREQRRDGDLLVIRSERSSAVRVGSGGPRHSFETLNGDIYVRARR